MSLFDIFKKKPEVAKEEVKTEKACCTGKSFVAPLTGKFISISEVPDQVFSQKMMGDGFAIDPTAGTLVAPFDGVVASIFPTNHAVGLRREDGVEVLLHIGVDTVNLNGEGFTGLVATGDTVTAGQKLVEFDLEGIRPKVPSVYTIAVFTDLAGKVLNTDEFIGTDVTAGDSLAVVKCSN